MAQMGGRNTAPELLVRKWLSLAGVRYRLQYQTPGGKADLAIPWLKFALFVDGCFWHGCPEHYVRPRTRSLFWEAKLRENVDRDRRQLGQLVDGGWTAVRVWEHDVLLKPKWVTEQVLLAIRGGRAMTLADWRVVRVQVLNAATDLERRHLELLTDANASRVVDRVRTTHKVGVKPAVESPI